MKNYTFIFLLIFSLYSSQIQRFTYEYDFITDSTNRAGIKKEIMLLDIQNSGSKYYSYDIFVTDSIISAELEKQGDSGTPWGIIKPNSNFKGNIRSKVSKEYPDYKTYLHASLSSDFYKIEETDKPIWKIHSDKMKIGSYSSQKATTKYLGRQWTAWFCTDLPFQDGPYKFYGLPGLIIKLEDKSQTHVMTLIGNKIVKEAVIQKKNENHAFGPQNEIAVNNQQFTKLWQEHVRDPNKITRQKMLTLGNDAQGNSNFSFMDATGKKLDPNEAMRNNEKQFRENLKKSNNRLDLDLYRY